MQSWQAVALAAGHEARRYRSTEVTSLIKHHKWWSDKGDSKDKVIAILGELGTPSCAVLAGRLESDLANGFPDLQLNEITSQFWTGWTQASYLHADGNLSN